MKKLVFAIQIFSLMALLPAYMFVELNHEPGKMPANNSSLEFIKKAEKSNIQPALNIKDGRIAFINAKGIITKETGKK